MTAQLRVAPGLTSGSSGRTVARRTSRWARTGAAQPHTVMPTNQEEFGNTSTAPPQQQRADARSGKMQTSH